jgi:hypothetical protein
MRPDVAAWLARARADAEARGLAALVPLLETLARSTSALRDAEIAGPAGPAYTGPDDPADGTSDATNAAE